MQSDSAWGFPPRRVVRPKPPEFPVTNKGIALSIAAFLLGAPLLAVAIYYHHEIGEWVGDEYDVVANYYSTPTDGVAAKAVADQTITKEDPNDLFRHMSGLDYSKMGAEMYEIKDARSPADPKYHLGLAYDMVSDTATFDLSLCLPQVGVSTDWVVLQPVGGKSCGVDVSARCDRRQADYCQPAPKPVTTATTTATTTTTTTTK